MILMTLLRRNRWLGTAACTSVTALLPLTAHAQGGAISDLATTLLVKFNNLLVPIAVLAIVILGLTIITTSDDSILSKAKTSIGVIVAALFLSQLAPRAVKYFFINQPGNGIVDTSIFAGKEVVGIAQFFQTLTVTIGVAAIILASFRAIASFGNETSNTQNRTTVLHVIGGIMIVAFSYLIPYFLFEQRQPNLIIAWIFSRVSVILVYVTLIMVAIIIYAGIMMLFHYADEQAFERSKGIIIRSIIGLLLVIGSYTLVSSVLLLFGL
jgi:hypothetical protein